MSPRVTRRNSVTRHGVEKSDAFRTRATKILRLIREFHENNVTHDQRRSSIDPRLSLKSALHHRLTLIGSRQDSRHADWLSKKVESVSSTKLKLANIARDVIDSVFFELNSYSRSTSCFYRNKNENVCNVQNFSRAGYNDIR